MGFSRYCPSCLDLTNCVVRIRRGAVHRLSLADSLESGNMGIWNAGNSGIWNPKIPKVEILRVQIRSAQNVSKVRIRMETFHNGTPLDVSF